MVRKLIFSMVGVFACGLLHAQVSLTNGVNSLELSGSVSTYYNYRILDSVSTEKDKNRFNLRDAQIQLEGRKGKNWDYELQVDLADLGIGSVDPENPGLMDAWMKYKGFSWFDIRLGYGKLAWSRYSLIPFTYSAYWQRPEFLRGSILSRRDIGLELSRDFFNERLVIIGSVYNGLGEVSLRGDNDVTGALEYVGRVEFSWPIAMKYRETDDKHLRKPVVNFGMGGRYTERNLPQGELFPSGAAGEYGLKITDGSKFSYGADGVFMYRGLSINAEFYQSINTPQDTASSYLQGISLAKTKGNYKTGGFVVQGNYFIKPLKLILSARYENYNLNDLLLGINERISGAIAYQFDGFRSMIKLQTVHILQFENLRPPDWTDQFRIGWQYMF
jgi:hypothetical protein